MQNIHVSQSIAEILNTFSAQTPYSVDDVEIPPEVEICPWCGNTGCERCEALYDRAEDGKHESI